MFFSKKFQRDKGFFGFWTIFEKENDFAKSTIWGMICT